jgi:hypothetical protein
MTRWLTAALMALVVAGTTVQLQAAPATPQPAAPRALEDTWPRPMTSVLSRPRVKPSESFAGCALVDILAGDDNWTVLADGLDRALAKAGLPVKYLDAKGLESPLVDALESQPTLLVVGSTRRFTVREAAAISHYVDLGGRVLVLTHASLAYTVRVIDVNTLLREFGITASFIRPQGASLLSKHPAVAGLATQPLMPWGVGLWSTVAEPLVKAASVPYVVSVEAGNGRVVVMDGKTLLLGTKALPPVAKAGAQLPFAALLDRLLGWLLA